MKRGNELSPERRLALFHNLTAAAHPSLVMLLDIDPQKAYEASVNRGVLDSHETPEGLAAASEDLTQIVTTYGEIYGARNI